MDCVSKSGAEVLGKLVKFSIMEPRAGFEPAACRLPSGRSARLSHRGTNDSVKRGFINFSLHRNVIITGHSMKQRWKK